MRRRSNKGMTVIEVMISAGITSLLLFGGTAMWIASVQSYDKSMARTCSDVDAVTAMQKIVGMVREAKKVEILKDGEQMKIYFPESDANGIYNRFKSEPNGYTIYLSDETSGVGKDGTYLWYKAAGGHRLIARGVSDIAFEQDQDCTRSVKITVITENPTSKGPIKTQLIQRVVYMRNY